VWNGGHAALQFPRNNRAAPLFSDNRIHLRNIEKYEDTLSSCQRFRRPYTSPFMGSAAQTFSSGFD